MKETAKPYTSWCVLDVFHTLIAISILYIANVNFKVNVHHNWQNLLNIVVLNEVQFCDLDNSALGESVS